MMARTALTLAFASLAFSQTAQQPRLPIHTLIREDIFAGYLFGDMERFQTGVDKLEARLRENPDHAPALAWRGSVELFLAGRAHESGDAQAFRASYAKARDYMGRAYKLAPNDQGVLAVVAASNVLLGDRLPAEQKTEVLRDGLARFKELEKAQQPFAAELPLHMKGELLAGIAQAAQRLGEAEEAKQYLTRIVQSMPGTPYEARAKKWLDEPETAAKSTVVCQTCHEPGRLKNRLEALKRQ